MNTFAVARRVVKPIDALGPPSPAIMLLKPKELMPGSLFATNAVANVAVKPMAELHAGLTLSTDCGRQEAIEAHDNAATAEPGQYGHEAQRDCAGLIYSIDCGRQAQREAQGNTATAEPGQWLPEAQAKDAGLPFSSQCGRRHNGVSPGTLATAGPGTGLAYLGPPFKRMRSPRIRWSPRADCDRRARPVAS